MIKVLFILSVCYYFATEIEIWHLGTAFLILTPMSPLTFYILDTVCLSSIISEEAFAIYTIL